MIERQHACKAGASFLVKTILSSCMASGTLGSSNHEYYVIFIKAYEKITIKKVHGVQEKIGKGEVQFELGDFEK